MVVPTQNSARQQILTFCASSRGMIFLSSGFLCLVIMIIFQRVRCGFGENPPGGWCAFTTLLILPPSIGAAAVLAFMCLRRCCSSTSSHRPARQPRREGQTAIAISGVGIPSIIQQSPALNNSILQR